MVTEQALAADISRPIDVSAEQLSLPSLRTLARQAVPQLLEGVVAPLAVFYIALAVLGLNGALAAAIVWVYGGVGLRLLRHRPVSGTMILTMIAITGRAALAWWTGSAVIYFLQPELGTICISATFLASVRLRRPLVRKLILDYIHLPQIVIRHMLVRRFFVRVTVLWAFVLLFNAALSIWLLLYQSIGTYLLIRPIAVALITILAFLGSVAAFRHVLHVLHLEAKG